MIDQKLIRDFGKKYKYYPKYYGDHPLVVIFGERYDSNEYVPSQIEIVSALQPEFFLHGFLGNYIFDPVRKVLRENQNYPVPKKVQRFGLKQVSEFGSISIFDEELTPDFFKWMNEEHIKVKGTTYELEYLSLNFDSRHGSLQTHLKKRESSIKLYVGCTLSYLEIAYLEDKLGVPPERGAYSIHCPKEIDNQVGTRIGKVIVNYAKRTKRPLVAAFGAHYIRSKSALHSVLQRAGVEYVVINQAIRRRLKNRPS